VTWQDEDERFGAAGGGRRSTAPARRAWLQDEIDAAKLRERKERRRSGVCVACGHAFDYVWTHTGCCCDSCAGTFRRWARLGPARARARITTYKNRIAELERIIAALESAQPQESKRP